MRSFIAINLPESVKSEIDAIIERLRPAGPPAKWVPGENLHLTLKFLDEITVEQVAAIRGAITLAADGLAPFEIRLRGFGVFPNETKARVFWIGIESGYEIMKTLAAKIDEQITPLGFEREKRPFSAHVTLARLREPAPAGRLVRAAEHMPYQSEPISVRSIELMKSVLSPKGASYSVLESVTLRSE